MSEEFKNCPACGRLISASAANCPHCGAAIEAPVYENKDGNNSGQGPNSQVPDIVAKRFNWGAFGFNWIWCLVYKQYLWAIAILVVNFIPLVNILGGLGLAIFYGIKGNSWAWQAKHYKSVEEFHKIHKTWAFWVLGFTIFWFLFGVVAALTIPTLLNSTQSQQSKVSMKKSISVLSQSSQLLNAQESKLYDFSSEGLTNYFEPALRGDKISSDTIKTPDGIVYQFVGDGSCESDGCYVRVDVNGEQGPNQEWTDPNHPTDILNVPLRKQDDTYIMVYSPDILFKK